VRIGSRPSRLSQEQTLLVASQLRRRFKDISLELVPIITRGDVSAPAKGASKGAKAAFTGDIESLLLKGEIDIAVHSMKDLPNEIPDGLAIGATPKRGDPRDGLLTRAGGTIKALPRGARVGTGSLRRKAQLLRLRSDIEVVDLAGNVDTRISKLASGYDAIVLAVAGLERIGEASRISQVFTLEEMVPSVCQGVIAVEIREDDEGIASLTSGIDDSDTALEAACERAFSKAIGGDCNAPVGGCARLSGRSIEVVGIVASEDGRELVRKSVRGPAIDALRLGDRLGRDIMEAGGARLTGGIAS
jgi:hydroxymethylbilane synthase